MNLCYVTEFENPELANEFKEASGKMENFNTLSKFISLFVRDKQKK